LAVGSFLRREDGALAAEDEALREVAVEAVVPAAAARGTAVLVGLRDRREVGLLDELGLAGLGDLVDVVDVARGVELRHEQGVAVPEVGLDKRAVEFLEAEGAQFVLDAFEEADVRICPSGDDSRRLDGYVVSAEGPLLPVAALEERGRDRANFLAGNASRVEGGLYL